MERGGGQRPDYEREHSGWRGKERAERERTAQGRKKLPQRNCGITKFEIWTKSKGTETTRKLSSHVKKLGEEGKAHGLGEVGGGKVEK